MGDHSRGEVQCEVLKISTWLIPRRLCSLSNTRINGYVLCMYVLMYFYGAYENLHGLMSILMISSSWRSVDPELL